MSYQLLKKLLFQLSPETSHDFSLDSLSAANRLGLLKPFMTSPSALPVDVMGITFPNPVGLAAGLDKNAQHIDAFASMGFGFIEVGTVTPRPQPGNPQPRLFRLTKERAIINRMGFNNLGIDQLIERVKAADFSGPIGINIGKNFDTPVEDANKDYLHCLDKAYPHATYITLNISSPNTPGLRDLQYGDSLKSLLSDLKNSQLSLEKEHGRYVPIAVKIAPDMDEEQIKLVADTLKSCEMDGAIAGNTTLDRSAVQASPHVNEAGGLSGAPLTSKSTEVVAALYAELGDEIPIIGVGGIMNGSDAVAKIEAGAKLVQVYTGFIYEGPRLVNACVEELARLSRT